MIIMHEFSGKLYNLLEETVQSCNSQHIALSGGLDSTILAYFLKDRKPTALAVIAKDFLATDLTYCQLVANKFDLPLTIISATFEDLLSAVEETIKVLKIFNDIEIRNSAAMYLVLKSIKDMGHTSLITGDGADELFAGYKFLLKKQEKELEKDLKRIWNIMHFSTIEIGKALGIRIETPFLDEKMMEFAKSIPVSLKVKSEGEKRFGKWILRKAFEEKIPKQIVWRDKSPIQEGSGTEGLTNLFDSLTTDDIFITKKKQINESDNVSIRSKESLHYYEIYRKYFDVPSKLHSSTSKCPYCQFSVDDNSNFCRMCGSFPI